MSEGAILKLFEVEFYDDKDGREPIKEYIDELQEKGKTSKKDRNRADKIYRYIRALQRTGTKAGLPYVKHIDGDIWELRPDNNRIFLFFWKDSTFVLVHHFIKKTSKTPKREMDKAKRNMLDYLERYPR